MAVLLDSAQHDDAPDDQAAYAVAKFKHSMNRPIKVVAWPAFNNRSTNPYNALLYEEIVAHGCSVDEYQARRIVFGKYDIFHIDWPDLISSDKRLAVSLYRSFKFLVLPAIAKARGISIVWTVSSNMV